MNKITSIIEKLGLVKHPCEGGYFKRNYTSSVKANFDGFDSSRALASAIYYLLSPTSVSRFHTLEQDEIWHFYAGDPVEVLLLTKDGRAEMISFGSDVLANQTPQLVIPRGTIFGAKLEEGGEYALFGATLTPEFHYKDYNEIPYKELIRKYPDFEEFIKSVMLVTGEED
jgi:predicted cupin superfamily sugar epimerase